MAFIIDFSCTQTLDCTKFTLTDNSSGYIGGQYSLVCSAVPGSPSKNNIPLQFDSPFINNGASYVKNIAISNSMSAASVASAIYASLSVDSNITNIFNVSIIDDEVFLEAKKSFIYTEILLSIDLPTDFNGVTITTLIEPEPKAPTREVIITFSDSTSQSVLFPFVNGASDTVEIFITKDYCMNIELVIDGSTTFSKEQVYVATCNADFYYRSMGAELDDRLDQGGCSDCILGIMEKIDNYRNSAISFASIDNVSLSQEFLDRIPGVYDLDCVC